MEIDVSATGTFEKVELRSLLKNGKLDVKIDSLSVRKKGKFASGSPGMTLISPQKNEREEMRAIVHDMKLEGVDVRIEFDVTLISQEKIREVDEAEKKNLLIAVLRNVVLATITSFNKAYEEYGGSKVLIEASLNGGKVIPNEVATYMESAGVLSVTTI